MLKSAEMKEMLCTSTVIFYIYMYVCVCMCVFVQKSIASQSRDSPHMSLLMLPSAAVTTQTVQRNRKMVCAAKNNFGWWEDAVCFNIVQ